MFHHLQLPSRKLKSAVQFSIKVNRIILLIEN